jgi:hypothetical protein
MTVAALTQTDTRSLDPSDLTNEQNKPNYEDKDHHD